MTEGITSLRRTYRRVTGAATNVVIGASYNDAAHTADYEAFSGIIDEVRLYGRALTAADVNALITWRRGR